MKTIRNIVLAGTMVLAVSAFGARVDNDANAKVKARRGSTQSTATVKSHASVNTTRNVSSPRVHHHTSAQMNTNTSLNRRSVRNARINHNEPNENHVTRHARINRANDNNVVNRKVVNRNVDRTVVERNIRRARNVTIVNNWRSARFNSPRYVVFRNYQRHYHPSWWWHNHYSRIVFVYGSPYYWDAGWWYPAWGYSPGISFAFDGPIYGYNGWAPDRVTIAVQEQLSRDGYYDGPIDGVLGPETRRAIALFQADHGLVVTSAIDEPTLSTLGVA